MASSAFGIDKANVGPSFEEVLLFRVAHTYEDTDPDETNNVRNIDTASARKLCTCLVGFRAAQLDYYDPVKELESRYHPPKYHTCDDISVKGPVEFCELR